MRFPDLYPYGDLATRSVSLRRSNWRDAERRKKCLTELYCVRGLLRRNPNIDIIRVQDVNLSGKDDPTILEWAAQEDKSFPSP